MHSKLIVGFMMLTVAAVFAQQPQEHKFTFPISGMPVHPTPADIEGFVYDQEGHPVAGAVVVVKKMGTGVEYRVIARDDGSYKFNRLTTADSYEVSVRLPQFEDFDVKGVNIGWKLATRLDVVLKPK
jgi:Carboxypeptidase regulatory-like domain